MRIKISAKSRLCCIQPGRDFALFDMINISKQLYLPVSCRGELKRNYPACRNPPYYTVIPQKKSRGNAVISLSLSPALSGGGGSGAGSAAACQSSRAAYACLLFLRRRANTECSIGHGWCKAGHNRRCDCDGSGGIVPAPAILEAGAGTRSR